VCWSARAAGSNDELLVALGAGRLVIDLDDERYFELEDLVAYVRRLLSGTDDADTATPYRGKLRLARRVARAVAERATPSFLIAQLVARWLAEASDVVDVRQRGWEQRLPDTVADAMEDYLQFEPESDRRRARELLAALALCAESAGLPYNADEDLWTVFAAALHGRDFSPEDVAWLLGTPAAALLDITPGEPACYRLFHRALVDHLRPAGHDVAAAQRRIARALRATVSGDWSQAPGYVREHLATHAAAGACLDELLEDLDYLLEADPARLLHALSSATAAGVASVRRVHRHAAVNLRTSERPERAAYLELAARQAGDDALADRFAALEPGRPWATPWAAWRPASEHYVLGSHGGWAMAVAVGELDGRAIVVSGGDDGALRVWELDSGRQYGDALTGRRICDGGRPR
jgi:hypothetical protein